MQNQNLKQEVQKYWNTAACGTEFINQKKFTQEYFQAIEEYRYKAEPEIFSFAQFSRFHGKKVLEVGVGAGTDFLQWVRSGAQCYGVDLTQQAIDHVQHRLALYDLRATEFKVADAESLPYPNDSFDLVYSWGVIHHSPDTFKCLQEIIRVTKPGGQIKLMIYNRRSIWAFYMYLKFAVCRFKPFQSFTKVLFNHQESIGTKAYTFKEIKAELAKYPVEINYIKAPVTSHELLIHRAKPIRFLAYLLASVCGWNKAGWYMMIDITLHAE